MDQYLQGKISKKEILKRFKDFRALNQKEDDEQIKRKFLSDSILKQIDYLMEIKEVFILKDHKIDTILHSKESPLVVLGDDHLRTYSTVIPTSIDTLKTNISWGAISWASAEKPQVEMVYSFIIENYADASTWRREVTLRMISIFALAFVLVATIISIVLYLLRTIYKEKQLVQMQTDFTNNINHELNTPLSSIAINIKNLTREDIYQDRSAHDAQVNLLQRQYFKLRHIVDQVLESDARRLPDPKIRRLNITNYLQDMITEIELPHHPFSAEIDPEPVMLETDIMIVEKTIDQLLENATKYAEPGKAISLKAFKQGTFFCIALADQGRGISKEHQRMIFNKFYRVPTQAAQNVKGLGIGLYLARISLQQVGAQISVQSQSGAGSVFTIKIPINDTSPITR